MAEFFDYDPIKGLKRSWDYDEMSGKAWFRHEQNVQPLLKYTAEARNTGVFDGRQELLHFAEIPTIVEIELRNKGIDICSKDPSMIRRMLQEIEQNYPYLKVTNKKMA